MAKFNIAIDVDNVDVANAVERALQEQDVLAFVRIVGALLPLSDRAKRRVITHAADIVAEQVDAKRKPTIAELEATLEGKE